LSEIVLAEFHVTCRWFRSVPNTHCLLGAYITSVAQTCPSDLCF
jgi:hypothetical protein